MQVKLNGQPADMQITLQRNDPQLGDQNLYADGRQVVRVTHSLNDAIPVVLALDNETAIEIEPRAFYTIDGMNLDWQPGTQPDALALG